MSERRRAFGIDATPIVTEHATRGIGRHVARTLEAAVEAAPAWAAASLGTLIVAGQVTPIPEGLAWRTRRSGWRPQDLDPLLATVADRLAVRSDPPRLWHHTDPRIPGSPLPAARTVVFVYDAIPLQHERVWAAVRPHRRILYRRYLGLARASRGVLASLASTAHDIETAVGIPADRIAIVPPYVRPLVANGGADADELHAGADHRFIFVGVLDPHKRPELALDAVAELIRRGEPAELTFIGARPEHRRLELERRAAAAGLIDRIHFAERPDDAGLDAAYRRSTLLATSAVEGFGQPPVEAILAGGRVVAVPIPAYRETVGGLATFATAATAEALADAAMAGGPPPGATARAALGRRFSAEAATDALRAAYDRFGGS